MLSADNGINFPNKYLLMQIFSGSWNYFHNLSFHFHRMCACLKLFYECNVQNQSKCWYTCQGISCSKYIYRSKWVDQFWLVKVLSCIIEGGQNDSQKCPCVLSWFNSQKQAVDWFWATCHKCSAIVGGCYLDSTRVLPTLPILYLPLLKNKTRVMHALKNIDDCMFVSHAIQDLGKGKMEWNRTAWDLDQLSQLLLYMYMAQT